MLLIFSVTVGKHECFFFFVRLVREEKTAAKHCRTRRINKDEQGIPSKTRNTYSPAVQFSGPTNHSTPLFLFYSYVKN
jgi:hypothetical protein